MAGKGLDVIPLRVPEKWDPAWFERFVRETLSLADARNAIAGEGIAIQAGPNAPPTVSGSADVEALVTASLVTAQHETELPATRTLTGETGVVELVDDGAGSTLLIRIVDGGLRFGKLQSIPGQSVLGAAIAGDPNLFAPAPILAGSNDRVLRRVDDVLDFGQLTAGMAPDGLWTYAKLQNVSTDARVLGIASDAPGPMTELTLSQVLDFIGSAAEGDILYRGASGWERLPRGTDGQVLTLSSGAPVWADPDSLLQGSYVTADDETSTVANSRQLTAGTGITLDASTAGVLSVENDNP